MYPLLLFPHQGFSWRLISCPYLANLLVNEVRAVAVGRGLSFSIHIRHIKCTDTLRITCTIFPKYVYNLTRIAVHRSFLKLWLGRKPSVKDIETTSESCRSRDRSASFWSVELLTCMEEMTLGPVTSQHLRGFCFGIISRMNKFISTQLSPPCAVPTHFCALLFFSVPMHCILLCLSALLYHHVSAHCYILLSQSTPIPPFSMHCNTSPGQNFPHILSHYISPLCSSLLMRCHYTIYFSKSC